MKYRRWNPGPEDELPDMWWCLQHGEFAIGGEVDPDEDRWCWRCLSDYNTVGGEKIIKCRVVHLATVLCS